MRAYVEVLCVARTWATLPGMLRNLYIRKGDEVFWAWAEEQAASRSKALSVWVSDLIRNHKYATGAKQATERTLEELLESVRKDLAEIERLTQEPAS